MNEEERRSRKQDERDRESLAGEHSGGTKQPETITGGAFKKTGKWKADFVEQWEKEPIAVIGMVIGFFVLIVSGLQWRAVIETNRISTRAWVTLVEVTSKGDFAPGKTAWAEVAVTNTGASPALNFTSVVTLAFLPKNQSVPPLGEPAGVRSAGVIGPNAKHFIPTDPLDITQARIDAVRAGQYQFTVYGKVNYSDIFGSSHETDFCMQWPNNLKTPEDPHWRACAGGNSAK